jgi:hypothetical protein
MISSCVEAATVQLLADACWSLVPALACPELILQRRSIYKARDGVPRVGRVYPRFPCSILDIIKHSPDEPSTASTAVS